MSGKIWLLIALLMLSLLAGAALVSAQEPSPQEEESIQAALGTAFTYQGQLKQDSNPVNGNCDFQFSLWDAVSGGAQIGATQTRINVSVSNGYFTIPDLDFGSAPFQGDARWLAIAVRCPAGSGSYTALNLRQTLTAAPYALYSKTAPWSGLSGVPAGFADGVDNDTTYTAGTGLTLAGTQFSLNTAFTDSRYWQLGGNSGTNPATHFLGTTDNQALELRVNNARALRLEPNATSPNVIGGYYGNSVTSGVMGAVIGGGGAAGSVNLVTDNYGTVGGGFNNRAGDNDGTPGNAPYATVGGGNENTASAVLTFIGGGADNTASGGYSTIGGGYINAASGEMAAIGGGEENTANGNYATIGGGFRNNARDYATAGGGNTNTASGATSTVGGGWVNIASGDYATIGGGAHNTASGPASIIGGGWSNTASGESAAIGGGDYNLAAAPYATIAGGGPYDPRDPTNTNNRVTDEYGAVGGGGQNRAGNGDSDTTNAGYATVSGGEYNTASGLASTIGGGAGNIASGSWATIGGGGVNSAPTHSATVGGGGINTASGSYATVGGGSSNTASGNYATVPGGAVNLAQGDFSFAAGRRAKAYNQGCFVLADATDADETCVNDNRFVFRVTNGFYIWTTVPHTAGVLLPAGGNAWSSVSDRAAKENFAPVDGRDLLNRLTAIPIQTWNYKSQDDSIRHIGPVAQDFHAAFGVGEDDTHISTVDADGVALAAIQGLYHLVQQKDDQIAQLEQENLALQNRLGSLEARIAALEQGKVTQNIDQPLALILPAAALLMAAGLSWLAQRKAGRR